jgi:hypothetical protein
MFRQPLSACVWETLFMPKANLRQIPGGAPLQDFERSVCKEKLSVRIESFADGKIVAAHKAAIFKEWDAHLYSAHRRQWDSQQAKKAKREAKSRQS